MKKHLLYLMALLFMVSVSCKKGSFVINKTEIGSIAIIVPDSANSICLFAAGELQKHLDLLFHEKTPVLSWSGRNKFRKYFFVGIKPKGFDRELQPEESVYVIRKNSIYIFGEDKINIKNSDENPGELKNKILSEALNLSNNRTGTLFAVYNFLENELGFKWIKPGDQGIFHPETTEVTIPAKESFWTPVLKQRNIRTDLMSYKDQVIYGQYAPKEFHLTEDEAMTKYVNLLTWMRRMRMGRSENFRFGHAYTSYWEKYKDTNPFIFALNGKGERKPVGRPERIKMCPSNSTLAKIIVNEWRNNLRNNPQQNSRSISGCENDSDGKGDDEWCHCDSCELLDARKAGEKLTDYATDRYVHLWNAILNEARKYDPDIMVTGYAYENMLQPPRRERLEDGLLIEFIPRMGGNFDITEKLYKGWESAGMKKMMYRPNDMNWEIGIPMGQEERLFSNFKLAISHNAIGTDFDSILGFWEGISDLTYYILAKGHVDPRASFEQLENEFLDNFGEAKEDISKYYLHWRSIFNNKILKEELKSNDGINTYFLEWHKLYRLTHRINEFYSIADFDTTDSYLKHALTRNISDQARNYIRRMQISNEHSRLTFCSFMAGRGSNKEQIVKDANDLIQYRIKNRNDVDINWNVLFQYQHYQMDDQIGTRFLGYLPGDLKSDNF